MYLIIFLILALLPFSSSTGIVWIRMSASKDVVARIEFIDRENSTRYGISFDIQLDPKYPREFVLPIPPASVNSDFPILHYTVQMMKSRDGSFFGEKFERRAPLLLNEPWIHKTVTDRIGISIFTSIRSECLPNFYGSTCQFYCPDKCQKDQCREKKCQNNSQCRFDGKESECMCQPGYTGEFCDIKIRENVSQSSRETIFLLVFFFLTIYFLLVSIAATIILRGTRKLRTTHKPIDILVEEGNSEDITNGKLRILTPPHIIFASLY